MKTPYVMTGHKRRSRGIALLLVMISLVVCSILTAGFLSSQGTSIGIARNERDAEKSRALAQSGIDLCTWLIKNRSDWRTAMTPGTWLNNYSIGEGTVTVTAASADGTSSFNNDTTQAAILTSVGSYDGRTFTLTATIGPTGGGTVFRGGNFTIGKITMGNSDGSGNAFIDSYNSSTGTYSVTHGSSALFGNNYSGAGALTVFASSSYNGSFVAGKTANLANAVYATPFSSVAPTSVSQATQGYTPGTVVVPNTLGLTAGGAISISSGTQSKGPGAYDSILLNGTSFVAQLNLNASGVYHVTGTVSIQGSFGTLNVNAGVNAVMVIDGNLSLSTIGKITIQSGGSLTIYVAGSANFPNNVQVNTSGSPKSFVLMGTSTNTSITLSTNAVFVGTIYAPQASVNISGQGTVYGGIICKDLTMVNNAVFHFDRALMDKKIDNLTGGSAPSGTANYSMSVVGTSAVVAH